MSSAPGSPLCSSALYRPNLISRWNRWVSRKPLNANCNPDVSMPAATLWARIRGGNLPPTRYSTAPIAAFLALPGPENGQPRSSFRKAVCRCRAPGSRHHHGDDDGDGARLAAVADHNIPNKAGGAHNNRDDGGDD